MTPDVAETVERYARFARDEAPGRSDVYAAWANAVATTPEAAAVLARVPAGHRQPPLVFAVTRHLGASEGGGAEWVEWLLAHADEVVAECRARTVQTNEPLRCAALLPALALIEGPLALLEVGASAGLCLFPDRYSYRYRSADGVTGLDPADGPSAVVLESRVAGGAPLSLPDVVWRAGIDLHPRHARDPDDRRWLTGLVWPGETGRRERIDAALDIAASSPPRLVQGDALDVLPALAAEAPADATLVVLTPGVLPYLARERRVRLIDLARSTGRWITMDAPALHEAWTVPPSAWPAGRFVLALDGRPLAAVDPLGASVEWRPEGSVRRG